VCDPLDVLCTGLGAGAGAGGVAGGASVGAALLGGAAAAVAGCAAGVLAAGAAARCVAEWAGVGAAVVAGAVLAAGAAGRVGAGAALAVWAGALRANSTANAAAVMALSWVARQVSRDRRRSATSRPPSGSPLPPLARRPVRPAPGGGPAWLPGPAGRPARASGRVSPSSGHSGYGPLGSNPSCMADSTPENGLRAGQERLKNAPAIGRPVSGRSGRAVTLRR